MKYSESQIERLIDQWHENAIDVELHEYLGWTWKEYQQWVETGNIPETKQAINRPGFTT